MIGTLINIVGVLIGGALGTRIGSRLPERVSQTVVAGLGLFTMGFGLQMFLKTQNAMVAAGSLLVGALLGEWWQIEEGLKRFGSWLEKRFSGSQPVTIGSSNGSDSRAPIASSVRSRSSTIWSLLSAGRAVPDAACGCAGAGGFTP